MRLRGLLPFVAAGAAGLAAGALVGLVRQRKPLGVTARRGPRTGAIEVDPAVVAGAVDAMVERFVPCGPGEFGRQPGHLRSEYIEQVSMRDAATGDAYRVPIYMKPEARAWNDPPVTGVVHTKAMAGRILMQDVTIKPAFDLCQAPSGWKRDLRQTTAHELSHASDPGRLITIKRRSVAALDADDEAEALAKYRAYVNSEVEVVANLTAVADELRDVGYDLADFSPAEVLQLHSRRWRRLKDDLTPENRKRFLRVAARLRDERRAQYAENKRRSETRWRQHLLVEHVTRRRRARARAA